MKVEHSLKKGDQVIIEGKGKHLLILNNKIQTLTIQYTSYESTTGKKINNGKITGQPAFYFNQVGKVTYTANGDTKLSLSAILVPDTCSNKVWYSNVAGSTISLSDDSPNPYNFNDTYSTCVLFNVIPEMTFKINVHFPEVGDEVQFDDQTLIMDVSDTYKIKSGFFQIDTKKGHKLERRVEITNADINIEPPTYIGFGFAKADDFKGTVNALYLFISIVSTIIIITIVAVGIYFFVKRDSKSSSYVQIATI